MSTVDRALGWLTTWGTPVLATFVVVLGIESDSASLVVLGSSLMVLYSIRESTKKIVAAVREQR